MTTENKLQSAFESFYQSAQHPAFSQQLNDDLKSDVASVLTGIYQKLSEVAPNITVEEIKKGYDRAVQGWINQKQNEARAADILGAELNPIAFGITPHQPGRGMVTAFKLYLELTVPSTLQFSTNSLNGVDLNNMLPN